MNGVAAHRALCERNPDLPIFQQAWWLDAACGDAGWDAVHVERGGQILATLPFQRIRRRGFTVLRQPPLTPRLGPCFRSTGAMRTRELGRQKELVDALLAALPPHSLFRQSFPPELEYLLPWRWAGFGQTTLYTYRLALNGPTPVESGFRENIRTDARKALREGVEIGTAELDELLPLWQATFVRQGSSPPPLESTVRRIESAAAERRCREILIARDRMGRPHAGAFIVWGSGVCYYLLGGGDPQLRRSGATSLLLSEAIRRAAVVSSTFDFEGSMIESIERFFRAFGGVPTPYARLERSPSRFVAFAIHARRSVEELFRSRDRPT